jgi:hypothetical protein
MPKCLSWFWCLTGISQIHHPGDSHQQRRGVAAGCRLLAEAAFHRLAKLSGRSFDAAAADLDCVAFDPFSFQQVGLPAAEVNVGEREVFRLVIALVALGKRESCECYAVCSTMHELRLVASTLLDRNR